MANYLHEDYNSVFYGKAQNLGRVLCKAYDEAFEKYDVLILPTIPKKAPVFPQQNPSLKGNVVTFVNMLLYFADSTVYKDERSSSSVHIRTVNVGVYNSPLWKREGTGPS